MGIHARILCDSISPAHVRITTMELRFHRFVLPELNTHRMFSRNAASSRAIPVKKVIAAVRNDPAWPIYWGANQAGMSAREELTAEQQLRAKAEWKEALDDALARAERLSSNDINLHKQTVNRLLEPFSFVTLVCTATDWLNFLVQRCHPDAQPEIQALAIKVREAYNGSKPKALVSGEWHLPLILDDERHLDIEVLKKVSVARCARVSYLTHDNVRDLAKDLELYERLLNGGANGHWSPMEHVATPMSDPNVYCANFRGWYQFRKEFLTENAEFLKNELWLAS